MSTKNTQFEIATWYDTWNATGLKNLVNKIVPLNYASRYNLAFGQLSPIPGGGYSIEMTGQYAAQVKSQINSQASSAIVYAGLRDTGIAETVQDNTNHNNRSTANIVSWLQRNSYQGISIDAEQSGMGYVAELVTQLGPSFRTSGLGIAISVPWPGTGPKLLYGDKAVAAFKANVNILELQDYSSAGTPNDVSVWVNAGIPASMLMGGVATENGNAQTSLADTQSWTEYALNHGLGGMFSWRLDNDHGLHGTEEDVDPTFTGAKKIYDTVHGTSDK